jgi:hypothetical protein
MMRAGPPLKSALKPSSRSIHVLNQGMINPNSLTLLTDLGEGIG